MKRNSNFAALTLSLVALQALAPALALAETSSTTQREKSRINTTFCERISNIEAITVGHLTEGKQKLQGRIDTRIKNIDANRDARDVKLAEHRSTWDVNREKLYDKLEAKASTTEQKAAVAAYQSVVEAAVKARKDAVDAAITAFRDGLDKAVGDRKAAVDAATGTFKDAVSAALAKAKEDCGKDIAATTVRESLKSALKDAQNKFIEDRKAAEKIKTSLETLRADHKAAVDKAFADFKAVMEKARTDLKAAFQS